MTLMSIVTPLIFMQFGVAPLMNVTVEGALRSTIMDFRAGATAFP